MAAEYEQTQHSGATRGTKQSVENTDGGRMQSRLAGANEQPWDQYADKGLRLACERGHDAPYSNAHCEYSGRIEAVCQCPHDWAAQRINSDESKAR